MQLVEDPLTIQYVFGTDIASSDSDNEGVPSSFLDDQEVGLYYRV